VGARLHSHAAAVACQLKWAGKHD